MSVLLWMIVVALVSVRISLPPAIQIRIVSINFPGPWLWSHISTPMVLAWAASVALAIAGAWIFAVGCRWFCRHLWLSNAATADFSGRGGQIVGWWIVWLIGGRRWNLGDFEGPAVDIAIYLVGIWATLGIGRWFVAHVELSSGERFRFLGSYGELLGWQVLLALSVLTVIGWAWVLAAIYRWMAQKTSSGDRVLRFHGDGVQVLWRTLATVFFSIPVVTIPWAWLWYVRWLVCTTTITGQITEID